MILIYKIHLYIVVYKGSLDQIHKPCMYAYLGHFGFDLLPPLGLDLALDLLKGEGRHYLN